MPRWAFIALLAGGVVVGLYIRNRRKAAAQSSSDTGAGYTGDLSGSSDAGLAGVGVTSPPGGVYPVTTPTVPEGLPDIIATLGSALESAQTTLGEVAQPQPPGTPQVNVTLPTGGGPPRTPPKTVPRSRGGIRQIVNVNLGNPRRGQKFTIQKAKGGVFHIYPGGRKVFVKKR